MNGTFSGYPTRSRLFLDVKFSFTLPLTLVGPDPYGIRGKELPGMAMASSVSCVWSMINGSVFSPYPTCVPQ